MTVTKPSDIAEDPAVTALLSGVAALESFPADQEDDEPDAAPAPEAGGTPDAAPAPEAGGTPDAAPAPEAGGTPDAAPAPEAGSTPDAAPAPEAGGTPPDVQQPDTPSTVPEPKPDAAPAPEAGGTPPDGQQPDTPSTVPEPKPDAAPAPKAGGGPPNDQHPDAPLATLETKPEAAPTPTVGGGPPDDQPPDVPLTTPEPKHDASPPQGAEDTTLPLSSDETPTLREHMQEIKTAVEGKTRDLIDVARAYSPVSIDNVSHAADLFRELDKDSMIDGQDEHVVNGIYAAISLLNRQAVDDIIPKGENKFQDLSNTLYLNLQHQLENLYNLRERLHSVGADLTPSMKDLLEYLKERIAEVRETK